MVDFILANSKLELIKKALIGYHKKLTPCLLLCLKLNKEQIAQVCDATTAHLKYKSLVHKNLVLYEQGLYFIPVYILPFHYHRFLFALHQFNTSVNEACKVVAFQ